MRHPIGNVRLITVATIALLFVPLSLVSLHGSAAPTSRVLTISTASAHPTVPFKAFDGSPPKVFDINGDGKLEIIAQNDNQWVYVFDSSTGALLAQHKTTFPSGWGARSFNGPEVAIMHVGGQVRLIVANSAAFITSFRFDAQASTPSHFAFVKEWERRLSDCYSGAGMDAKPVLADLNKDGRFEILGATEEKGLYALRDDGTLYWKNCLGGGNAEPTVADLNLDGWPDVLHVSDGGNVAALDGRTGGWIWNYYLKSTFLLGSGSIPVGAGIGQLDGIAGPDVVVGARDSHDAVDWSNDHALLAAIDSKGKLLWSYQDPNGNPLTYTHPVIVDADRNGRNEVYWGDWNTIGHKPPANEADAWKPTGPAHFYRFDSGGNVVWRQTLNTYWSNKDLALADVDGDGVQEVLANGPGTSGDGIWYLDSRTGAKEAFVSTAPWKVSRAPIVADLWGTGTMQWVVPVLAADGSVSGGAIQVYNTHARYSSVYPHLPYPSLTGEPTTPPPTTTPPTTTPTMTLPPGSTFGATFTIKAPNAWWQELRVTPDTPRTIDTEQVRLDNGEWKPMTLRSWGAYASSYYAPSGTKVEFLARDTNGATSQSEPFTWLDGNLTKRSLDDETTPTPTPTTAVPDPNGTTPVPSPTLDPNATTPPPNQTIEATFTVSPNINRWWVEVDVDSSQPIATVHARTNGGTWTILDPTNWGSWANSYQVPQGAQVQFRATDFVGGTAFSGNYTWP